MLHLLKLFIGCAQAFVFQAPQTDSAAFQSFLVKQNQESYQTWKRKKLADPQKEAHEQVLRFSQKALSEKFSEDTLKEWERLRLSLELSPEDREVFYYLAIKLSELYPQKESLQKELCRHSVLEKESAAENCDRFLQKVSLTEKMCDEEVLLIDGISFTKNQAPTKMLPGPYRWQRLSNIYQDESWQGDLKSFGNHSRVNKPWVIGRCKEYHLDIQDFELITQSQIYFSETCLMPGIPYQRTWRDWAQDNKNLLVGVGVVAAGLVAYSLKDKTLVITLPSK